MPAQRGSTAPAGHAVDRSADRDTGRGGGAQVGYGQTWTAAKATRLGLVPIGYADGYPRLLSNRGTMMVAGQPAPVAGRVSMDLTVIDLQNAPQANVGDDVTILDDDPISPASVYRIAELAGDDSVRNPVQDRGAGAARGGG